jgi:hypothetical protein
MALVSSQPLPGHLGGAERVSLFPRLWYMGSQYRLASHLAEVFTELGGRDALDAFSGSGVLFIGR